MTDNSNRRLLHFALLFFAFPPFLDSQSSHAQTAETQTAEESNREATAEHRARELFFENEVRPLLVQSCIKCHGNEKQEGGLRLDSLDALLKGGDSGPAVAPGAVADSLIVSAVRYEDFEMPPSGQLSEEAQAVIATWVEQGAVWPQHAEAGLELRPKSGITDEDKKYWAFQPLAQPPVPSLAASQQADRARTPIDAFLIEQLDASDLLLAPEADRRTLLRRVYFDLVAYRRQPPKLRSFSRTTIRTLTSNWSIACSTIRVTVKSGRVIGSTSSATPNLTASIKTLIARVRSSTATGLFNR